MKNKYKNALDNVRYKTSTPVWNNYVDDQGLLRREVVSYTNPDCDILQELLETIVIPTLEDVENKARKAGYKKVEILGDSASFIGYSKPTAFLSLSSGFRPGHSAESIGTDTLELIQVAVEFLKSREKK